MSRMDSYQSINDPPWRRLRCYAFDPSLSTQLDTAMINEIVAQIPWDFYPAGSGGRGSLEGAIAPGPVNEYLEVIDFDPASDCFYAPVDLNDPRILAQDGLPPSETNPQFHQQMVFAVAMLTIMNFERALGRRMQWKQQWDKFVRRLRIYPHALRQANAFYSPGKCALLFGYFPASEPAPGPTAPRRDHFHLSLPRHHCPRDDARSPRWQPPVFPRAEPQGCPSIPRGVRRHRRPVPALHLPGVAAAPDRQDAR